MQFIDDVTGSRTTSGWRNFFGNAECVDINQLLMGDFRLWKNMMYLNLQCLNCWVRLELKAYSCGCVKQHMTNATANCRAYHYLKNGNDKTVCKIILFYNKRFILYMVTMYLMYNNWSCSVPLVVSTKIVTSDTRTHHAFLKPKNEIM